MSFDGILRGIVDQCAGCLGVALMGADGIPIAEAGGAGESDEVTLLGAAKARPDLWFYLGRAGGLKLETTNQTKSSFLLNRRLKCVHF